MRNGCYVNSCLYERLAYCCKLWWCYNYFPALITLYIFNGQTSGGTYCRYSVRQIVFRHVLLTAPLTNVLAFYTTYTLAVMHCAAMCDIHTQAQREVSEFHTQYSSLLGLKLTGLRFKSFGRIVEMIKLTHHNTSLKYFDNIGILWQPFKLCV